MTPAEVWTELGVLSFSALAIFAAVVGPLRWARTSAWRQDLFELRNDLWDHMREYGTLDTPAHQKVRESINAAIRLAPSLSLFSLLYIIIRCPWAIKVEQAKGERSVLDLIADVKNTLAAEELRKAYESFGYHLAWRLFVSTFPGMFIGIPILVYDRCFKAAKVCVGLRDRHRDKLRQFMEKIGKVGAAAVPA